jgi:small subunit ribosomal protein S6
LLLARGNRVPGYNPRGGEVLERIYETIFILRPTLNDQEISEAIESYRDLLVREGAEMYRHEDLGKKKLAYEIKHFQNGHYAIFQYRAKPSAVNELERTFKISEDLLRYLTVRIDEAPEPEPEPEVEPEAEVAAAPEVKPAVAEVAGDVASDEES